jgi:hypothetical protein
MTSIPGRNRSAGIDALWLAAIALLSVIPYVTGLGFYSDDWGLLPIFQSGAVHALSGFQARPVQGLYLLLLFKLFGLEPLGYHVVNALVIAASGPLLYLLLLRIGIRRPEAFSSALLFLLLPQLSTVRVWYAAFQIPMALLLMLLSMHAQMSFERSGRVRWLLIAIGAALLSLVSYEIFAPMIAAFAVGLAIVRWRTGERRAGASLPRAAWVAAAVLVLVIAAAIWKALVSGRTGPMGDPERYWRGLHQLVRLDYDWRVDGGLNIFTALLVHFWFTLRGWAEAAAGPMSGALGPLVTTIAIAIAALAFWRLRVRSANEAFSANPIRLMLAGIAAFVLGHAPFLIVPWIRFSPSGLGNRTLVAAAIGVAMIIVAAVAYAVRAVPARYRGQAFALAIAILAFGATARVEQIDRYWAEAPALQRQVLIAAKKDLRWVPAGSTIILDGVCPYHGPAVVFETYWDVGGALSLTLGRYVLGDTVSPRMSATPSGLSTSMYKEPASYPYAPNLFIYDPRAHRTVTLDSAAAAERYFNGGGRQPLDCPIGYLSQGVPV